MQLSRPPYRPLPFAMLVVAMPCFFGTNLASAEEPRVQLGTSYFGEKGGPLYMRVISPEVNASADIIDAIGVDAGYSADIVSGASVAVVDSPAAGPDVISSATQLTDFRQVMGGGVTVRSDTTSLRGGYAYGFEKDYRSQTISLAASTSLFQHNTTFDLTYVRDIDQVCDFKQPRVEQATEKQRLPSSAGCFTDATATVPLNAQSFQVGWTQTWTPLFATQLVSSAQIINGFQSNPYRAVWLGRTAAQEHQPENRARYAIGINTRLWVEATKGAIQFNARGYRDTWDIRSLTFELAYEQSITEVLRLRFRGRYYDQTGAAFYSDDYSRNPKGQYFTGDRELSPMSSLTPGVQLHALIPANASGKVAGFLSSLDLIAKGDFLFFSFPDFHYGNVPVPNNKALVLTLAANGTF